MYRKVTVFSAPGCTTFPDGMNAREPRDRISIYHDFVTLYGGCSNRFRFYVVPPEDSVVPSKGHNWGTGERCRRCRAWLNECIKAGLVRVTPTLKALATEQGLSWTPDGDLMEDSFHLKEQYQKIVHQGIWKYIDDDTGVPSGMGEPIPVVILDFNAGANFMKANHQRYLDFYGQLAAFGKEDPAQSWTEREERLKARDRLAQAVDSHHTTSATFTTKGRPNVAQDTDCSGTPWNPAEWGDSTPVPGFLPRPGPFAEVRRARQMAGTCARQLAGPFAHHGEGARRGPRLRVRPGGPGR